MKILIIGERYSENLGDPVICETVYNIVSNTYKNAQIDFFDISGKINYNEYYKIKENRLSGLLNLLIVDIFIKKINSNYYNLYSSDRVRYKRTIEFYNEYYKDKKYDIAIFAGGALFMDYFSGLIYYLVKKLNKNKTKIIFNACGMGKLSNNSIALLKKTFNRPMVKYISLRDSYLRFIQLFETKCVVEETYDIALNCNRIYCKSNKLQAEFGIGIISLPEYYDNQKDLVQKFYYSNYSWKLFTNGAPWDQEIACSILKELGIDNSEMDKYIVPRPIYPQELVNTITSFNTVISYRMHSQVIATSFLMPCYGFVWDKKVIEFFNKINCSERCFNPNEIDKCLKQLLKSKTNLDFLTKNVRRASDYSKNALLKAIIQIEKI